MSLSFISFNPRDPSFNSIGDGLRVSNYCGYVGSFLADSLFQALGLSAWFLVIGASRMAWLSFKGQEISFRNLRLVWALLLVLTVSCLVSAYLPNHKIFNNQIFVGGIIGLGLTKALIAAFNNVGMQVLLWSSLLMLTVFFSEKTVQELAHFPISALGFLRPLFSRISKTELFKIGLKTEIRKKDKKEKIPSSREFAAEEGILSSRLLKLVKLQNTEVQQQLGASDLLDNLDETDQTDEINQAEKAEAAGIQSDPEKTARRRIVMKTKVPQRVENWNLPKISLIEDPPATRFKVDEKEIRRKADLLTEKLAQFSVTGEVVAAKPGPAVTMFEFKPSANVKLSKITELSDDLSLALSSESLRIIAPIPGRDVVGIETSNTHRETVYLKDMLADENFWKEDIKLPVALGKQANGEPRIVDLRKMPHLMVAGTTGSGKSVFVVSTITGLLFKHSPKTLRLILIDPKQVDLTVFDKIPHLIMPTVTETRNAVNALKWAVREMEKRYRSMNRFAARGLEAFNETVAGFDKSKIEENEKINLELEQTPGKKNEQYYFSPLPYIVIVVEEFGDLMTVDKANVETAVVRLAQMARACGIHLILAMQSPRKEVVTGLIKTNIPGRISFKVNAGMDSRIILDETGAERLLAQGDMLYKSPGGSGLLRHHGPFLKDSEIAGIAKFWADQAEPEFDLSAMKAIEVGAGDSSHLDSGTDSGESEYDERYDEILSWVSAQKDVSASLIQRRFQLGYPRAARIVETFEREGVVGPANGSKPRQVLVSSYKHLDE